MCVWVAVDCPCARDLGVCLCVQVPVDCARAGVHVRMCARVPVNRLCARGGP